jgi:hypothetical protein
MQVPLEDDGGAVIVKKMFAAALWVAAFGFAGAVHGECLIGEVPQIPDGSTATKADMVVAQRRVKAHVAETQEYLACVEFEGKGRAGGDWTKKYIAASTRMEKLAAEFNKQLRAFQLRDGSSANLNEVPRTFDLPPFAALAGYKVCDPKAVAMLTRGPLELRDLKHDKALVAGDIRNNNLYHQDRQGRQNGLFNFKSVDNCAFEITDTKHNLALVAGDVYNGYVYHQLPQGRANARWELWRVEGAGKVWGYVVMDQKHRQNLIAGDAYDGNVYEQSWNGRANGLWRLFTPDGDPVSLP